MVLEVKLVHVLVQSFLFLGIEVAQLGQIDPELFESIELFLLFLEILQLVLAFSVLN